ncbi:MAG TPA: GspH/FimT family pseudopilin [Xanthomonadales bacterium]|nr:GspH/FimT family pseudopilin [Xanthomonadales bacterium]
MKQAAFQGRGRGFTLVELLVVLAIIALSVGLVATSISRSVSGAESRQAARKMVAALRYTRTQAILKKSETVFMVDTEARSYQAPGKDAVVLPEGMDVVLTTARTEMTSEAAGGIRFFPDGGSTGGHVELIVSGREYRVDVAWLTGEARLAPQEDAT